MMYLPDPDKARVEKHFILSGLLGEVIEARFYSEKSEQEKERILRDIYDGIKDNNSYIASSFETLSVAEKNILKNVWIALQLQNTVQDWTSQQRSLWQERWEEKDSPLVHWKKRGRSFERLVIMLENQQPLSEEGMMQMYMKQVFPQETMKILMQGYHILKERGEEDSSGVMDRLEESIEQIKQNPDDVYSVYQTFLLLQEFFQDRIIDLTATELQADRELAAFLAQTVSENGGSHIFVAEEDFVGDVLAQDDILEGAGGAGGSDDYRGDFETDSLTQDVADDWNLAALFQEEEEREEEAVFFEADVNEEQDAFQPFEELAEELDLTGTGEDEFVSVEPLNDTSQRLAVWDDLVELEGDEESSLLSVQRRPGYQGRSLEEGSIEQDEDRVEEGEEVPLVNALREALDAWQREASEDESVQTEQEGLDVTENGGGGLEGEVLEEAPIVSALRGALDIWQRRASEDVNVQTEEENLEITEK